MVCTLVKARGWPGRVAAEKCGLTHTNWRQHKREGFVSAIVRAKVENGLGVPIWSTLAEFSRRQHCLAVLGYDPTAMPEREVRERSSSLPLRAHPHTAAGLAGAVLDYASTLKPKN